MNQSSAGTAFAVDYRSQSWGQWPVPRLMPVTYQVACTDRSFDVSSVRTAPSTATIRRMINGVCPGTSRTCWDAIHPAPTPWRWTARAPGARATMPPRRASARRHDR